MLSSKRLLQMVKKWQKVSSLGRRRIMSTKTWSDAHSNKWSPTIANRGHIFVYSYDGKRFTIPLSYLTNYVFRELLRLSEEDYGLPSDGPITLACDLPSDGPITLACDAATMAYLISMYQYGASVDVERAMFSSIAGDWCSVSHIPCQQQHILYGF